MVNDCAYVGQTLIKYLPSKIETIHIKRSRHSLGKTFGIAWKIFRSKGDIYHVHYLLQDCYLALKFGKKPIIGHAHGSDIRETINQKVYGRIVRYNLKNCDKILVSTPNLLKTARKYNENAEYLPNLIDESMFYPKERKIGDNLKVLIASSSDWKVKGTDKIILALSKIKSGVETSIIKYGSDSHKTLRLINSVKLHVNVLPKVPHSEVSKYYWDSDVVIEAIGVGGTLGMGVLEAIACGRPVITHVSSEFPEYKDFPLLDVSTPEEIASAILSSRDENLWKKEYEYFKTYHNSKKVINRLKEIYIDAMGDKQ